MKNYFYNRDVNLQLLDFFVKIMDYNFIKNCKPQVCINNYEVEVSFHISNYPKESPISFDYSLEQAKLHSLNETQDNCLYIEKTPYSNYYCKVIISKEDYFSEFERLKISFEDLQLQFINDYYSKKYIPKFLEKIENIRKYKILNFINFAKNNK